MVQQLKQVLGVLVKEQSFTAERYIKVRQDNSLLTNTILMLEEQLEDLEGKEIESLHEEQEYEKEVLQRLQRERELESENFSFKLQMIQKEKQELTAEVKNLKLLVGKLQEEKIIVEEELLNTQR